MNGNMSPTLTLFGLIARCRKLCAPKREKTQTEAESNSVANFVYVFAIIVLLYFNFLERFQREINLPGSYRGE